MKNKNIPESELEDTFLHNWNLLYPRHKPVLQHRFHPTRRFRFDFAWPQFKVAVEVQGMGPGHCSLSGMTKDYDRHLEAMLLNWKIVFLTTRSLNNKQSDNNYHRIAQLMGITINERPINNVGSSYIPLSMRKKWK